MPDSRTKCLRGAKVYARNTQGILKSRGYTFNLSFESASVAGT